MTSVKPGDRLRSRVCTTEVIILKAPTGKAVIACGGQPMATMDEQLSPREAAAAGSGKGSLPGKRYADDDLGLELLCVKGGSDELTVNGQLLQRRGARPLPAADGPDTVTQLPHQREARASMGKARL